MVPLLLGYSMVYVNQLVDKILVTGLKEGAVTALYYGQTLSQLVTTFIVTFASILFSYVTSAIADNRHETAALLSSHVAMILTVVFLPISIVTVMCSEDIVSIAYGRGNFDSSAVKQASMALKGDRKSVV